MRRCATILIVLCAVGAVAGVLPAAARAQTAAPAPETPGEQPKDRYIAEMNNLQFELREGLERVTRDAALAGEGERPALREAREEFERREEALRKVLAEIAEADPFSWEDYKPAADAAASALKSAYGKVLTAVQ